MEKINITNETAKTLIFETIAKCAMCHYSNICVYAMRENCVSEILKTFNIKD